MKYSGGYFDIRTEEPLPETAVLTGAYGELKIRTCQDGIAVYDSHFLGTGFTLGFETCTLGFPKTINGIPVTEIHHRIGRGEEKTIAVEGGMIKRAYFHLAEEWKLRGDPLAQVVQMMGYMEKCNGEIDTPETSIHFYNPDRSVQFCEIISEKKLVIDDVAAKELVISAPAVYLKNKAYPDLEMAKFTGDVYPYSFSGWDGEEWDYDYFSGLKKLKVIDGSLRGEMGWNFSGCTSLERVHLSNGILRILPYAFHNCTSLQNVYVPDTVKEIGEYAFAGCTSLIAVHLPDGIKKLPKGLFEGCRSLQKCFIPASIEEIEDWAFSGCSSMKKPWIPDGIKNIGERAFDHPEWRRFY